MTRADVIVVGLGAMGSATLLQLAKRGVRAVGIDRFSPPHEEGSSHGETRITRQAIGEGELYVPLVLRAHEIWREIEAETGEELLVQCGGLFLAGARSSHPVKPGFMDQTLAAARRYGIPHETLSPEEVQARFPQFILEGDERAYFEPGAGFVYPERCIAAQLALAERAGAALRRDEPVLAIERAGQGVRVRTARDVYEGDRVVLAAGAWSPGLAGAALQHMAVYRQVLGWFAADDPAAYAPGRFPVFIWLHGSEGEQSYGFPAIPGHAGVKVATETYGMSLARPEEIDRTIDPAEIAAIHARHVAGKLRGVQDRAVQAKTCLYTLAPDSRFAIDAHPESERITIVSACSGHGFKHSAAIGEAVAERLSEGRSRIDLSPFALPREAARAFA
ncbi:MAG: N-methyl-L-tryptophan oxidase [Methylobacteriaceae bacterium]|nr:N-methyl-L-tryptophan oxidase [Methylobacteriaceae bacterium]